MLWETLSILIGLPIFVLHFYRRKRQKNEPPLDKGFLPWLGHAVEFGKDAAKFLKRMKEKHGDIFTVRIAGNYVTVLLDPNSFDSVLNDTVCLDFTHIRNQLVQKVFGLQLPGREPTSERKWMEGHFQGLSLFKISTSMKAHLQSLLLGNNASCVSSEWRQGGLFDLSYSLLFRAGFLTLFESRDDPAAVYREFRKFDELLAKLARCTLNHEEKKTVRSCQERLWKLLSPGWLSEESDSWQQSYYRFLQEEGMEEEMQNRALLLQLWVTQAECWNSSLRCATYQLCKGERVSECLTDISDSELLASTCSEEKKCNAGPAAFWLLGFLLTHPEAMKAVKSEIRGLRDTSLKHPPVSLLEAHCTPVLDSVLSETLRLTAAVMIRREVVQDKILLMADGQEYRLRRGDRVCLFPLLSPQMDPQIHQEPQIFKYNRFLNEDMTVKDHFHKNGKKLKYYTMPWGAGRNSCVGKEFAVTAIKQFVFLLLTHLDLETCDPEAKLPPVNSSRYGFGMLQPDGDLQVRYRLRRTQHEM